MRICALFGGYSTNHIGGTSRTGDTEMTLYGKVLRRTDKAILFHIFDQDQVLPAPFHLADVWFPLSQIIGPSTSVDPSDRMLQPQQITPTNWIMQQKAQQLGCLLEEASHAA